MDLLPIDTLKRIVDNVEQVILGKRAVIEQVLIALISKGHVLIEDVPGVGKTSLVSALARSLDCSFKRIQFTSDIMPSDITGFSMYNRQKEEFEFRHGAVMSQFVLADEINRTSPKTQASLLEVMEENQVTVDGNTFPLPAPFMVLATQNPVEYLGTFPLPEAQLDRFFMRVSLGYPSRDDEKDMLMRYKLQNPAKTIRAVATAQEILDIQAMVCTIFVEDSLHDYIVDIVSATRRHPNVVLGCSPRASLSLYRAAQAYALYQSRNYVLPSDIQKMAVPVLSHRMMVKQHFQSQHASASDIVTQILEDVCVPIFRSRS